MGATAFGGNFNKAALIFLTLILPFLQVHTLPGMPYIAIIWLAVVGNVAAFSAYAYLQILEKEKAQKAAEVKAVNNKEAALLDEEAGSEDNEDESDDGSYAEDDSSDERSNKIC